MPVLRLQLASAEGGGATVRLYRCADRGFRRRLAARRRAGASRPCSSAVVRRACSAADDFGRLLRALAGLAEFDTAAEITLEANPGTIERGRFAEYRDAGINRVSLGAQSFSASARSRRSAASTRPEDTQSRGGGAARRRAPQLQPRPDVRAAGPDASRRRSPTCAGRVRAEARAYLLLSSDARARHGVPFPAAGAAGRGQCLGDAAGGAAPARRRRLRAVRGVRLCARRGRCRHNLNYWLFGDYLGIGAGAHGKISQALPGEILRTVKPRQPRDYLAAAAVIGAAAGERNPVPTAELPFEFMLNALRLNEGFGAALYEARTGLTRQGLEPGLQDARARGLIEPRGSPGSLDGHRRRWEGAS